MSVTSDLSAANANIIIPITVMSIICGIMGFIAPWLVPKGPNRGVVQVMLVTTAFCLYLFWLCCILAQMNPLIGPELNKETLYIINKVWLHKEAPHTGL